MGELSRLWVSWQSVGGIFFFQAEDGIRDTSVTGVQTCALPILDLYHGRGAFEVILADEDVEEDPDRWCSYTECGQELWQIARSEERRVGKECRCRGSAAQ